MNSHYVKNLSVYDLAARAKDMLQSRTIEREIKEAAYGFDPVCIQYVERRADEHI